MPNGFPTEINNAGDLVDVEDLKELIENDPVKQMFHLILMQSVRDRASDIFLGVEKDKEITLRYKINEVTHDLIPPPYFLYEDLGERIGLTFGLIRERPIKQGLLDRLRGIERTERVLSPNAISNINPTAAYQFNGEEVRLKLVRGDFNDSIGYHIQISYSENNRKDKL